jgi:hypothetical protein
MKIAQKYSHLNGEEYLIVHHKKLYAEIKNIITSIDASKHKTKVSKEKTKLGQYCYSPDDLNNSIKVHLRSKDWNESVYRYYVTTDRKIMQETVNMTYEEQKNYFSQNNIPLIKSYKQTDFVKHGIAIEVQFGKYAFVAYDLFVKHMLFYSGGIINIGIEILPTKLMQKQMSTGIAYYEGEVYNVMRHGRGNPPVPLLILGIEP